MHSFAHSVVRCCTIHCILSALCYTHFRDAVVRTLGCAMLQHPSHVVVCRMSGVVRVVCIPSEVVDNAANAAFAEAVGNDLPASGGRKVDIWSLCFQGGTFDRVKERCRV